MWTEIFGTASACPHYTSVAMWYAHYDGKETFDDYAALSFGGWTKPTVKQYKGTTTKSQLLQLKTFSCKSSLVYKA